MPLTPSNIKRATDASGDDVRTFDDGGVEVPGTALVGDAGEHVGIEAAPIITKPKAKTKSSTGGALESTHNAKNTAGTFYRARVTIDASYTGPAYLMVFDLAAPPGAVAPTLRGGGLDCQQTAEGRVLTLEVDVPGGLAMANGIQVALSSTLATYTAAGAVAAFDVFFE